MRAPSVARPATTAPVAVVVAEEDEVEVKDANVLVRPRHGDHARHGHAMVPVERIVEWR